MKIQTSKSQIYCPVAAVRYARVLYEVNVPAEAVQKTREIFSEVPQLHDIFVNPTIDLKKKMTVIDKVFPEEIRNFLKVVCKYQRMDLIEDIFAANDRKLKRMIVTILGFAIGKMILTIVVKYPAPST